MPRTPKISRRQMLAGTAGAAAGCVLGASTWSAWASAPASHGRAIPGTIEFPERMITRGPEHHWFGYYDKFQFGPSNKYVLGMQVTFEGRSPRTDDEIKLGLIELDHGDKWTEIGATTSWGWQQGCMLQWRPGAERQVIFNVRQDELYGCRILDLASGESRTLEHPIYTISPDGAVAMTPDFRRINDTRPGYGYAGFPDPFKDQLAPEESGIFRVDLETGEGKLVKSLAEIATFGKLPEDTSTAKHWVNHLLFNPDGTRLILLHRWKFPNTGFRTRMLTMAPDGSDLRLIDGNGVTSHFIWKNAEQILAWSRQPSNGSRFYLFRDADDPAPQVVGPNAMTQDGHCNYVPSTEWIINDTYPDKERNQTVYLYHPGRDQKLIVGKFPSPQGYSGEYRCDTHPRVSRDGRSLVIDSAHGGLGRQMHLIDISAIHDV